VRGQGQCDKVIKRKFISQKKLKCLKTREAEEVVAADRAGCEEKEE